MHSKINKEIFKQWVKYELNFQSFLDLTWDNYRSNYDIPNCNYRNSILILDEKLKKTITTKVTNNYPMDDIKLFYIKELTHHIYDNIDNIPLEIGLFKGNNNQEYKYLVSVHNELVPYILYAELNGIDIYFAELNKNFEFVETYSIKKEKILQDKKILKTYKIKLLNETRFVW